MCRIKCEKRNNIKFMHLIYEIIYAFDSAHGRFRGTKRLVSVNICSAEGNSAAIFVSKVSPGIFVAKEK